MLMDNLCLLILNVRIRRVELQLTLKSCCILEISVNLDKNVDHCNFIVCLMRNSAKIATCSYCLQHPKPYEEKVPLTSRYAL